MGLKDFLNSRKKKMWSQPSAKRIFKRDPEVYLSPPIVAVLVARGVRKGARDDRGFIIGG